MAKVDRKDTTETIMAIVSEKASLLPKPSSQVTALVFFSWMSTFILGFFYFREN